MQHDARPAFLKFAAIAREMERLRSLSQRDTPQGRKNRASWAALEEEGLDLIAQDGRNVLGFEAFYTCGSVKFIEAIPAQPRRERTFHEQFFTKVLAALPIETYGLAIEKEILPPWYAEALINHRPFDPAWTKYLTGTLASQRYLQFRLKKNLWKPDALQCLVDPIRVAAILRAQAQSFSDRLDSHLSFIIMLEKTPPQIAALLYLAGARPGHIAGVGYDPKHQSLYELMTSDSAHDRLAIIDRYGDIEAILSHYVQPAPQQAELDR